MTTEAQAVPDEGLGPSSGLIVAVEKLVGRALSKDEAIYWQRIQDTYGIADDDPLVMVVVLLAVHQHLFNGLPAQIGEATERAITIHRTTLEDQATIVAKGLLEKLTPMFVKAVNEAGRSPAQRTFISKGTIAALSATTFVAAVLGSSIVHFFSR
ncbi:hypothetical protein P9281_34950 [Caballeronia sp. LP003]|uniref:hypothetical protein n=1 Tax=Caballeronia sp. LP003 TaxID=3038551 RepID=UPI002855D798|nr:hypothetical protein [Caballeronia sp. LP003]MDR5791749.1 hypothetical protein [Caballeronia sp. LP003]